MRVASFVVDAKDGDIAKTIDASIVVLGGTAGGIAANVNRWRGQIGLPRQTEAQIRKSATKGNGSSGEFLWFSIITDKAPTAKAIYAAIIPISGRSVFVKMSGKLGTLQENELKFLALCRSVAVSEAK